MSGNLAPFIKHQWLDDNGNPLSGGKLYAYQSGTTTPQNTYTDSGLGTPNANPVILDSAGRAAIWLDPALSYKFVLKTSADVTVWTVDSVVGLLTADAVATASLQASCVTTAKIADDAVTSAKLADDASVDANRAVTTDHLRDSLITAPKINSAARTLGWATNVALSASIASNALTVALKGVDGNNPSSTNPLYIAFRSATATTGTPAVRSVTSALSVVVSSGSTLGHASAVNQYVYVYAIDNAGTVELAVSSRKILDEGSIQNTTAEGGAGAADSGTTLYSTTARTGVAVRLLGRIKSNQATAGTWASSPTEITIAPFGTEDPMSYVRVSSGNGHGSTNTKIRRFTTTVESVGSDITYADSSTNGASFTINRDGVYSISYGDYHSNAFNMGISLNSTQLTTSIGSITDADVLYYGVGGAATGATCAYTGFLRSGDVVRPHTDGTPTSTGSYQRFTICRVA